MTAAHYSAVADLAGLQFDSLSASRVWAGDSEGFEEASSEIDLVATLDRIEQHAAQSPAEEITLEAYVTDAINALGLANFSGAEVVATHQRVHKSGVRNQLPTGRALYEVAIGTILDQHVRDTAGMPLRRTSLFRSKDYNRVIGGAPLSQHPLGTAKDRSLVGGSTTAGGGVAMLAQIDEAMEGDRIALTHAQRDVLRRIVTDYDLGITVPDVVTVAGGLGRYNTFIHRDQRGKRTRW